MAYSLPLVAPTNFILRLKIHCSKCETKVKKFLLQTPGIHSVKIDAKEGKVEISGTVEPSTVMMLLEKGLSLKAELLWKQTPAGTSSMDPHGRSLQIVAESKLVDERFNDPDVVAQLQQLSGIKGLKSVEVSYSKKIKLVFGDENDDLNDKNLQVIIQNDVCRPKISSTGGGTRRCGAPAASCCHGHDDHGVVNNNINGSMFCRGGHGNNHTTPGYPVSSNACPMHGWPPHSCGCVIPPAPAPPWSEAYTPSAPPIWTANDDARPPPPPPPPPAGDILFFNQFSDENPSGSCIIL